MGLIPAWEDPLEKGMAIDSSIFTWKILWTEEAGGLQSTGSQRVGYNWATTPHHQRPRQTVWSLLLQGTTVLHSATVFSFSRFVLFVFLNCGFNCHDIFLEPGHFLCMILENPRSRVDISVRLGQLPTGGGNLLPSLWLLFQQCYWQVCAMTTQPVKTLKEWLIWQRGFPGDSVVRNLPARRCRFEPWVGKIPWRGKWKLTPVFLPGKSHGQRSLAGCSPRGCKSQTWLRD